MSPIPYNGDGGYLSKDDIIKGMAAEIEMLKKELNISNQMKFTYMDDCTKMIAENARLKAEVERLTRGGDCLLRTLLWTDEYSIERYNDAKQEWLTAKTGKQPWQR